MANWIPTSSINPCPVCGDGSGKCRHTDDPDLVLCMTGVGATHRENRGGWIYLGDGKSGLWGIWRTAESIARFKNQSADLTPAQRYAAAEERKRQEELQRAKEVRQWKSAHSLQQIATDYQKLLTATSLSSEHNDQLKARGLSDADIDAAGFRTVTTGDRVGSLSVSGVRDGRWVAQTGIFIPHRDLDGNIQGGQIRTEGNAKYVWTAKPHTLSNDSLELPLAVWGRGRDRVILCEGGLKANVTASRFDRHLGEKVTTIGAAGGLFSSSPNQLKNILGALGVSHVHFAPDAGAISNKQVFSRDSNTIALLERLGVSVSILYWGQGFDKSLGDIDETNLNQIQTISPDAYRGKLQSKDGLWDVLKNVLKAPVHAPKGDTVSTGDTVSSETTAITLWDKRVARRHPLQYKAGQLPEFSDWLAMGSPSFEYGPRQRKSFWKEAILKGYKHILDRSAVGSGKSHDCGEFPLTTKDSPEIGRTLYLAADHNPDTETIQKYYKDTPSRHDGLMIEKTALGFKQRRMTAAEKESGVTPSVEANCAYSGVFNAARERGYELPGGTKSPICQSCPHFEGCQVDGFLSEQKSINSFSALRGHPDQFQRARKGDVIFWEETGKIFQSSSDREISLSEVAQTLLDLQTTEPELYRQLRPIAANLYSMIRDRDGDRVSKFGKHHGQLMAGLQTPNELFDYLWDEQAQTWLAADDPWNVPSTSEIINLMIESSESDSEKWSVIQPGQTVEERMQAVQSLIPIWVKPVMAAIAGENDRISFSANYGRLTITEDRPNHRRLAHSAAANIYLDATIEVRDLAGLTRVSQDHILQARERQGQFENLEIRVLGGMGRIGANRGKALSRIRSIWQELQTRHASIGVLDYKRYLDQYPGAIAGAWMRDNRGSNAFKDLDALLIVGSAIPNLGAMAAKWKTLTGQTVSPGKLTGAYGQWVSRLSLDETIQAIGRLRAQHTPDRKTVYLTGDNDHNLAAIADYFPGCKITVEDAGQYSPDALTKGHARLRAIAEMTKELIGSGAATLKNLSCNLETSISNISQTIKRKMGMRWSQFKAIISDIVNGTLSDRDVMDGDYTLDQLEAIQALEQWLTSSLTYCDPSEIWDELHTLKETVEDAVWRGLWDWINPQNSIRLITQLLRI